MSATDNNDWTSEERSLITRLPRTMGQDGEAEERLVFLLKREGAFSRNERTKNIALRVAMFATAASFVLGVLVGRVSAGTEGEERGVSAPRAASAPADSSLITVTRIIAM